MASDRAIRWFLRGYVVCIFVFIFLPIFASLVFFSLTAQAQGQSGRVDIIGDAAVEQARRAGDGADSRCHAEVQRQDKERK